MGLIKAWAIYSYGKKKGTRIYEDAVVRARTEVREELHRQASEDRKREKCSLCGYKYMQHDENGSCPTYL
jgi:hypothetical protein